MLRAAARPDGPEIVRGSPGSPGTPSVTVRARRPGSIQAVHVEGLLRFARHQRCTLVLSHVVGDFVPAGGRLIQAYGADVGGAEAERKLHGMIAQGVERTIEQDPAFAVRIMVDIAIKALSPAVNDPTTAVQVLNHLGDLLQVVGSADFESREQAGSSAGRVLMPARGWDEYVALGITEIRRYGASSVQVARRLRALLEELHEAVPEEHRAAVEDELARLEADVARELGASADLDRAGEADRQGLGGAR